MEGQPNAYSFRVDMTWFQSFRRLFCNFCCELAPPIGLSCGTNDAKKDLFRSALG